MDICSVEKLCAQLISCVFQRCHVSEDLCRLSIILNSSPTSDPHFKFQSKDIENYMDAYKGMSTDDIKGLVLALSSSVFIGVNFIVKKKGLKKADASDIRAARNGRRMRII